MIRLNILKNGSELNILEPANERDFGCDLISATEPNIVGKSFSLDGNLYSNIDYIEYDTQLIIQPVTYPTFKVDIKTLASLIFPRSSISKYNLVLANSVAIIDEGYLGHIKLRFKYIAQPEDYVVITDAITYSQNLYLKVNFDKIYKKGDKCAQLVCVEKQHTVLSYVDELNDTTRGLGGFGSSGA